MPATAAPRPRATAHAAPPVPAVPFVAAAHEHTEPIFDVSVTPGAAAVNLGPFDIPSYGYARHITLQVTGTGGVLGAGALSADYPFNLFQSIAINDVNGAPIVGPLDGYAALWMNIAGGYAAKPDPRLSPWYVSTINAQFPLRLPFEISHHDGLGAVANQNSAASYRVAMTINPTTVLYSTPVTTPATFRIRGFLEAWSLPNETDLVGRPQAQTPPAHGTLQFWSFASRDVGAGAITMQLPRMGNLIRNLVVIARTAAGARADTVFPDPFRLTWDARTLLEETQLLRQQLMFERTIQLVSRDTGVYILDFDHSANNTSGDDTPALWLPTVQSSRMELQGNNTVAGNLQILTNDIAPGEVTPSERYVETSETGFHPQVGQSIAAAQ